MDSVTCLHEIKQNLILGEHRAIKAALPPTTMLDDLPQKLNVNSNP